MFSELINGLYTHTVVRSRQLLSKLRGHQPALQAKVEALAGRIQELEQSEARWRSIVESAPIDMVISTWEWNIAKDEVYWSENVDRLFGTPADSYPGSFQSYLQLVHDEDRHLVEEKAAAALSGVSDYAVEHRISLPDGSVRWLRGVGTVHRNQAQEPVRILGIVADITAQREAEAVLRDSEEKYRLLFETAQDAIVLVDGESKRIVAANRAACSQYGYTKDEIIGLPALKLTANPEQAIAGIQAVASLGPDERYTDHVFHRRRSGEVFPVEISAGKLMIQDRSHILVYFRDITERERAKRNLAESEARFRALFEQSPLGIVVYDLDGRPRLANPAMAEMAQVAQEHIPAVMQDYRIFDDPILEANGLMQPIRKGFAGEALELPPVLYTPAANLQLREFVREPRWIKGQMYPVRNAAGDVEEVVIMQEDVTTQVRMEEERQNSYYLLDVIGKMQELFIRETEPEDLFAGLLEHLLEITDSEYGFIGEIRQDSDGAPYLQTRAMTDISWNEETQRLYEENRRRGFTFANMNTLFGAVITTGEPLIANDPANHPASGGLPEGHPPMNSFLGLPIGTGTNLAGMIGIANRPGGYTEEDVAYLQPFLTTCSNLLAAMQREKMLKLNQFSVEQTSDAVFWFDVDGTVHYANQAAARLVERNTDRLLAQPVESLSLTFADENWQSLWNRVKESGSDYFEASYQSRSGRIIPIDILATYLASGDQEYICIFARDISERKRAETQIQESLQEKEILLKEIHHRVKNNLQIIASLLQLQSAQLQDELAIEALQDSRGRINSMALIHEMLYQSEDLARIDFTAYVSSVVRQIFAAFGSLTNRIRWETDVEPTELTIDQAIPCGLILNELVTNSLQHGFPGQSEGTVQVRMAIRANGECVLQVADDGVGMTTSSGVETRGSLGLQLVELLADQLNGSATMVSENGTCWTVRFPLNRTG